MVHRMQPRVARRQFKLTSLGKEISIYLRALAPAVIPDWKVWQFCREYTSLNGIESSIIPLDVVMILFGLSMIAKQSNALRDAAVVRRHRSCFSTSTQVFPGVKAKCCCQSYGTCHFPAFVPIRKILRTMRLASVLDNTDAVAVRKFHNWIHVCHLSI